MSWERHLRKLVRRAGAEPTPGGTSPVAGPMPAADGQSLEIDGLVRRFGDRVALDGLSFAVAPGRIFGFLGPNGSGKTTTMRIVLGIDRADEGIVRWGGDRVDDVARARFGYMPEQRGLYPKMKVRDQLVYLARLHRLGVSEAQVSAAGGWLAWASPTGPTTVSTSCPTATSNGSSWPPPSSTTPTCSCSTSRSPASTPSACRPWSRS